MENETMLQRYHQEGSTDLRNEILVRNLALVHHVAQRVTRRRGQAADYDDLVSAGTVGLIEAIEHFDPGRGHAFSTYAAPRIRGAILDDLRLRDRASRSVRKKERSIARAREALTARLERTPREDEVARELEVEVETLWQWKATVERLNLVSLDEPIHDEEGGKTPRRAMVAGEDGSDVQAGVSRSEEAELLRREIGRLPERERTVLSLYYFEELKLREIGRVMGVTESRVSQIRTKALALLRERMALLLREPAAA